ncbi:MAG: cysteine desulfurase [Deltaproteobacteria bacterium]|nr:cysteine desulfurase [Deltaproteobacteria bacterium]
MTSYYLDNAATTRMLDEVRTGAMALLEGEGLNPSSLHRLGISARETMGEARRRLAGLLGVPPQAVVFTSGGTESDNLALRGVFGGRPKGDRLLISALEHPAVSETARALERAGVRVEVIPVTPEGVLDLGALDRMLDHQVAMVSCMSVSNEMGTLQPLVEAGRLIRQKAPGAVFHVDAVQGFTKGEIPWRSAGVGLLSLSGHKVHGPKGVGALIRCRDILLEPQMTGGGQESGLRSGTENPFGAAAFALAAQAVQALHKSMAEERMAYHRRWLEFLQEFPRLKVYRSVHQTPYLVRFSMPPVPAEVILLHLEQQGLFVSTTSACSTRKAEASPVLLAAGLEEREALSSIRLSFSVFNRLDELEGAFAAFRLAMAKLGKL